MKVKLSLLSAFCMLTTMLLSACKNEFKNEAAMLSLDKTAIHINPSGEKVEVKVTTNQPEFTLFYNPVDWLDVQQTEKSIQITAKENLMDKKRSANILVLAGGASKSILVTQDNAEGTLNVVPEKLEVEYMESVYRLRVETNTEGWKAETNATWMQLNKAPDGNEIEITVSANKTKENRSEKIIFTKANGEPLLECLVTQKQGYYLMPYLKPFASLVEVSEYESKRGGITDLSNTRGGIQFLSTSPMVHFYKYMAKKDGKVFRVYLKFRYKSDFMDQEVRKRLMDDNGFKQVEDSPNDYTKTVEGAIINANFYDADGVQGIVFDYTALQANPMKSFDKLPMFILENKKIEAIDENAIKAYEAEWHGVFDNAISEDNMLLYRYENAPDSHVGSFYILSEAKKLQYVKYLFSNVDLAVYEISDKTYVTKEFIEVARQSGFKYLGRSQQDPTAHGFLNEERKIQLIVRKIHYVRENFPETIELLYSSIYK